MTRLVFLLAVSVWLYSCGSGAGIKGHIICGQGPQTIILESIDPSGQHIVDSVITENGKFSFRVELADKNPAIYNIRCKNEVIPLLVSPGERIRVSGIGNISRNYTVEGSEGSALMRELAMILNNGAAKLDSLNNVYTKLSDTDTLRRAVTRQFVSNFYDIKRSQIKFIVTNPGSLASLYALYQRLPNDRSLFNGNESDVVYYRMVADSVTVKYPTSAYLVALNGDISRMSKGMDFDPSMLEPVNYPDITMPDMYGKQHKLSSLEGNVVLLDFWSASVQQCRTLNAELKELYEELHPAGFEVFQVSVDTSKPLWVTTVQDQKLPWITTCDFRGESSPAVMSYVVRSVPTNFLFNRQGEIVAKNLYGKALADKIKSLL